MQGYDVMVRFFIEAADENDACAVVKRSIYTGRTGGIGYEVMEAFESEEDR